MRIFIILFMGFMYQTESFAMSCSLHLTASGVYNISFNDDDYDSHEIYSISRYEKVGTSYENLKLPYGQTYLLKDSFEVIERGEPSKREFKSCVTEYEIFSDLPKNKSIYKYEAKQEITLLSNSGTKITGLARCTTYESKKIDDPNCTKRVDYGGH